MKKKVEEEEEEGRKKRREEEGTEFLFDHSGTSIGPR